jgi:hypothetical protein
MRSRAVVADRANRLWQKEWHDMQDKKPRPHGSFTSQRAAGSEFLGRPSNPHSITVDPRPPVLALPSTLGVCGAVPAIEVRSSGGSQ